MAKHLASRTVGLALLVVHVLPTPSRAWNPTGHRIIASIAYRELDEPTRARVEEILRKHPAHAALWDKRPSNGPDAAMNLFWNASVFPDDARQPPWDAYNRPTHHYVNYRILTEGGTRVEPPVEGENVLNTYVANLRRAKDRGAPMEERAVALSWVFHQAGDIHQPLHAVARFSKALPEGDRGGNGVTFPNHHARTERGNNLHAYWDDLLGIGDAPDAVEREAAKLVAEYPRGSLKDELTRGEIRQWAEESVQVSLKTVYRDLDPEITKFADAPVAYETDGHRAARRRAVLAGYRLADDLRRLFISP
jgi:hypothetical protein